MSSIDQVIMTVMNASVERDRKAREAVRSEISTKGTWWAADEIHRLRRELASATRQIETLRNGRHG